MQYYHNLYLDGTVPGLLIFLTFYRRIYLVSGSSLVFAKSMNPEISGCCTVVTDA
jgi:hypothetical protein